MDRPATHRVIDAHIHVYPAEVAADPIAWARAQGEPGWSATVAPAGRRSIQGWADPEAAIADMDEAGIDACVILGWYWERQETCDLQNRWHVDWIRRHPGRFAAFAAVQPAAGHRAIDALERALDDGLCGVGELLPQAQGFGLEDPAWRRVVETAIRHRVPINLHATDPEAGPSAGPKTPLGDYVRLSQAYPEATFILAHWGGGLAARGLADATGELPSNLYFDTAASPLLYDIGIFRRAVDRVGASRILFGSDYPLMLYPRESRRRGFRRFLEEIDGAGLKPAEQESILSGNLRRILPAALALGGPGPY
ncbi:MAG TPA: amidohydrolase family protein [Opitutaceae bacterium]|jgi:hypothetical protein